MSSLTQEGGSETLPHGWTPRTSRRVKQAKERRGAASKSRAGDTEPEGSRMGHAWVQGPGQRGAERRGQLLGRTRQVLSAGPNEATATGSLSERPAPRRPGPPLQRPLSVAGRVVRAHLGARPAAGRGPEGSRGCGPSSPARAEGLQEGVRQGTGGRAPVSFRHLACWPASQHSAERVSRAARPPSCQKPHSVGQKQPRGSHATGYHAGPARGRRAGSRRRRDTRVPAAHEAFPGG